MQRRGSCNIYRRASYPAWGRRDILEGTEREKGDRIKMATELMEYQMEKPLASIMEIPIAEEMGIQIEDDMGIKGAERYKAIVVGGRVVSIVSVKFSLIQHKDVLARVEEYCDTKGYIIKSALLLRWGAKLMVEISCNDMVEIDSDEIQKRCLVINAYDARNALAVLTSGMRLVCSNGLVAPGFVERLRKVHVFKAYDLSKIEETIEAGFKAWNVSFDVLKRAVDVVESTAKVLEFVKLPEVYINMAKERLPPRDNLNNIWNELTRILTHESECGVNTRLEYYKAANKVFQFLPKRE